MSSTLYVATLSITFGLGVGSLMSGILTVASARSAQLRTALLAVARGLRFRVRISIAAMLAVVTLAGCANPSASGGVYSYQQAQQVQLVQPGTVLSARPITIQASYNSGAGMAAGSAIGGLAGSAIESHKGSYIAAALGALFGGLAGNSVERTVSKATGLEIVVRLDSGQTQAVAQEADIPLKPGQRVNVLSGAGASRVVPI